MFLLVLLLKRIIYKYSKNQTRVDLDLLFAPRVTLRGFSFFLVKLHLKPI